MGVQENISLKALNSFGIEAKARFYNAVKNIETLKEQLKSNKHTPIFILGGGSNILLTKDIEAHVLHICNKGIKIIQETDTDCTVEIAAGENWHDLVMWSIREGLGGIENLALIPGSVGAAPIQNIGAYGTEIKDSFVSCQVLEIDSLKEKVLTLRDCQFGYRSSIFKTSAKGQYIITSVQLSLSKKPHILKTQYGDITKTIEEQFPNISEVGIAEVAKAVTHIRKLKLPDPVKLGNSGSFFKNPIIDKAAFNTFIHAWPEAPFYELGDGNFKVPAGWLIEKAGLKGHREGAVGVHEKQGLVLVNYGGAQGSEVVNLAQKIMTIVFEKFQLRLEPEVNIIPAHTFH